MNAVAQRRPRISQSVILGGVLSNLLLVGLISSSHQDADADIKHHPGPRRNPLLLWI